MTVYVPSELDRNFGIPLKRTVAKIRPISISVKKTLQKVLIRLMLNLSMPTRKIFLEKYGAEEFKDEIKTNLDLRHNYQKCQENLLSYKGNNLKNFFLY